MAEVPGKALTSAVNYIEISLSIPGQDGRFETIFFMIYGKRPMAVDHGSG